MTLKHPGKTAAQARVLDHIGCGDHNPPMAPATQSAMLKSGLIEPCGFEVVGSGAMAVRVPQFQMPISVHMDWCAFQAESCGS